MNMERDSDRISRNVNRWEQRVRQSQAQDARERRREIAIERDRYGVIGEIVCRFFPELLQFQPYRTQSENLEEFAPLIGFLRELASDKEFIARLKECAARGRGG